MINNTKTSSYITFSFLKKFMLLLNIILLSLFLILLYPNLINASEKENKDEKRSVLKTEISQQTKNNLRVDIIVDPKDQNINAVGSYLYFSKDKLSAKEIDLNSSFCELFITSEINNQDGLVTVLCGKPNPGISSSSIVAQIDFDINEEGSVDFIFDSNSSVLLNDGFGTNVLQSSESNSIELY